MKIFYKIIDCSETNCQTCPSNICEECLEGTIFEKIILASLYVIKLMINIRFIYNSALYY